MAPVAATPRTLHFVVPAYDEWENVPFLLQSLAGLARYTGERIRVVVVDDGSTDGTGDVAQEIGGTLSEIDVHVVRHTRNRGPGAAFRTGFRHALAAARDDDFVVSIEADNTSDALLVPRMLDRAERGADLVLATVYGRGRIVGASLLRRLLSAGANSVVKMRFGLWGLTTFSSFFRLHRASLLREAFEQYGDDLIREPGFVCMVEMLVKLRRVGARVDEVPMLLDAGARRGASKMNVARTVRRYASVLRGVSAPRAAAGTTGPRSTKSVPERGFAPALPAAAVEEAVPA